MNSDTISAISTALSDSGIGVIRISGEQAISVADRIFCNAGGKRILENAPTHTVHYGYITEVDKNMPEHYKEHLVDEVMATVLRAPKSYTTEDTVEFSCHGGIVVLEKILKLSLQAGARLAQPGEFTKRAFLNGRIDLSRAEAVMDVIHSQNEYALKSSIHQLTGHLSQKVKELREQIIYEIAFIESAIDDPEHYSLEAYPEKLAEKTAEIKKEIARLLETAEDGRRMKEGIRTVILGKPNAGKSSLLNQLSGSKRAIVTEIEGTTRDILDETVNIGGITLHLMDTAGIRNTSDKVEQIGVELAKQHAMECEFILYVADTSKPIDENDRQIISLLEKQKFVVLLNKSDLPAKTEKAQILELLEERKIPGSQYQIIHTSMTKEEGMEDLKKAIETFFFQGQLSSNREIVISSLRHKEALENAYNSLSMVEKSLADGMPEDFYSIDLMSAYSSLGQIIGEEVDDDLVNTIFAKFCMGK